MTVAHGFPRRRSLRYVIRGFLDVVDEESVGLVQAVFYGIGFVMFGVYALVFADKPAAVRDTMFSQTYTLWVWMCLIGPLTVLLGYYLDKVKLALPGAILRLVGDIGTWLILGAYWLSLVSDIALVRRGTLAAFIFAALLVVISLFILRDVRRMLQIERGAAVISAIRTLTEGLPAGESEQGRDTDGRK
ncbi:hypothetical protein SEA_TYPHA_34 [Mycobacterium phage Typha]|uniref:Uncharacterized protein n=1 Tax=Mycobacterium phage Typha TaxID=2517971 RepID=A0A482JCJ3_9CAUD|nr:membrane protein [Mycobacterium phage Typha]QBP29691.1 hypothetical protein SEA_TYPHA_34 [Mycobacterium phage Typha]URM86478.1 hypothetical protein PBI_HILLTOPFARM_34 [Mycobacterium phage Hilltopfarm]